MAGPESQHRYGWPRLGLSHCRCLLPMMHNMLAVVAGSVTMNLPAPLSSQLERNLQAGSRGRKPTS